MKPKIRTNSNDWKCSRQNYWSVLFFFWKISNWILFFQSRRIRTLAEIHRLFQQWLWWHYLMALEHLPMPNPIQSNYAPISKQSIPIPNWNGSQMYRWKCRIKFTIYPSDQFKKAIANRLQFELQSVYYPMSRVTEHPDKNRCFKSQVGSRINVSCVKRAQPLTSSNFNFVLVFKIRWRNSSFMSRDSSASDATDNSSSSGKPSDSI